MRPLLIEKGTGPDPYYTGPLMAGVNLILRDRDAVLKRLDNGNYRVSLCDQYDDGDRNIEHNESEWGQGPTVEEAWRYALGAMFGPLDEEYDEARLAAALKAVTNR